MKNRIFRSFFCIAVITLVLTTGLIIPVIYQSFLTENKHALENEATYLAVALEQNTDDISVVKQVANKVDSRITLIQPDGTVVYDNTAKASQMDNHKDRPEVKAALADGVGHDTRLSKTLDESTYYYAIKLSNGNVLRLGSTTRSTLGIFGGSLSMIAILLVIIVIFSFIIGNAISESILEPLRKLDLEHPLDNDTYPELSPLFVRLDRQQKHIQRQVDELTARETEFIQVTDGMSEGLVLFNDVGHVLSINPAAIDFFVNKNGIGTYLELSRNVDYLATVEAGLSGRAKHTRIEKETRCFDLSASPVVQDDGKHATVLFIRDVTEVHHAEQMRREFSANVSHELKTPLTSILGYSEIMAGGIVKAEDCQRFAGMINTEATRLLALIQDIIKLSKLEEADLSDQFAPVDLYAVANRVTDNLERKAKQRQITIKCSGESTIIEGIAPTIYEMIYNLADNAITYNREGGSVNIRVITEADRPVLKVSDNGIGIQADAQERIFERFYREDGSHNKSTGGTGLGLSIVKHGVQIHHATIRVDSVIGKGTTFTVRF